MMPNNISLSFNQPSYVPRNTLSMADVNTSAFTVSLQATNTFTAISTTNGFNAQFNEIFTRLSSLRATYQQQVNNALSNDPNFTSQSMRNKGVSLAWQYEKAELEMGGSGTRHWTDAEKQDILKTGKVEGAEGHHINNVHAHPKDQANPDNVNFARDRQEHKDMHGGDFRNDTEGKMYDRDQRLKDVNHKRVFKNEIAGVGIAAAIGLGMGFTIGFVVTLAQAGVSTESAKLAAIAGAKAGIEGAGLGVVNHLISRSIGEIATGALQGVLGNIGITVTENVSKMCKMGVVGGLAIVVFSVYQFTKLKIMGYNTKECIIRVGKQAAFSITLLVVSIVAQGFWGGAAGIIVSMSVGFVVLIYKTSMSIHDKNIAKRIHIYTIEKNFPHFLQEVSYDY
ncbi:hypothetical protein DEAC_c36570 [Desulfosporosinus acididurans]|uniref:Tox-GHH domain-containing protein n=1 Tax=Desulfosporosinus acididurans TaxID=476652 RepID=A0A0J1FLW8_9FIRM|nr:hypothetical protein [Desulfosporosinus acididurans]KLU64455.1 hypothetical protein DEAC_c36570 [Desulfosporosinus acididurans]